MRRSADPCNRLVWAESSKFRKSAVCTIATNESPPDRVVDWLYLRMLRGFPCLPTGIASIVRHTLVLSVHEFVSRKNIRHTISGWMEFLVGIRIKAVYAGRI